MASLVVLRKRCSGNVGHLLNISARWSRCASIDRQNYLSKASPRFLSLCTRARGGRSISAQSALNVHFLGVISGAGSHTSLARFGTETRRGVGEPLLQVDAFTDEALRGNPAAILFTHRNGNEGLGNNV